MGFEPTQPLSCEQSLKHLSKLAKLLSCVVRTCLYCVLDLCVFEFRCFHINVRYHAC